MSVPKIARSHSDDPKQEHLRERKADWNEQCREFIAQLNEFKPHLIAFKRALNGRGDVRSGLPTSNIKDPFPTPVASFLGETTRTFTDLNNTFARLAAEANGIIQEQAQYATTRKKPRSKTNPGHSVIRSELNELDGIVVEGSNKLTRFWSGLSSLILTDKVRTERLSALTKAHELFRSLNDLEDSILERGTNNIRQVVSDFSITFKKAKSLQIDLEHLCRLINQHDKQPTPPVPPVSPPPLPNKPLNTNVQRQQEVQSNVVPELNIKPNEQNEAPDSEESVTTIDADNDRLEVLRDALGEMVKDVPPLQMLVDKFNNLLIFYNLEKNPDKKEVKEDMLRSKYKELEGIYSNHMKKNSSRLDEELVKNSASLSGFINKYKHKLKPDASSSERLSLHTNVRKMKKKVDAIMDLLESRQLNCDKIRTEFSSIIELIAEMLQAKDKLVLLHEPTYLLDEDKLRAKHVRLDPVERELRRNLYRPGR